jgi:hypothetical protein
MERPKCATAEGGQGCTETIELQVPVIDSESRDRRMRLTTLLRSAEYWLLHQVLVQAMHLVAWEVFQGRLQRQFSQEWPNLDVLQAARGSHYLSQNSNVLSGRLDLRLAP